MNLEEINQPYCFLDVLATTLPCLLGLVWFISRTFSANEQYFFLTPNQPTVLSATQGLYTSRIVGYFSCSKISAQEMPGTTFSVASVILAVYIAINKDENSMLNEKEKESLPSRVMSIKA